MVAYSSDKTDLVINTSGVEVDNFTDLTREFEAGDYKIEYYSKFSASGTVRAELRIYVDAVEETRINEGLFSNPEPSALCNAIITLTEGSHTIGFKTFKTGGTATVTLSDRYYTITKIS